LLLQCPDWRAVRRFKLPVAEPVPYTRLAVHYLSSDAALSSPERDRARNTDWRKRMTGYDWFNAGRARAFDAYGARYHAVK
jgi:hypothetical protein